MHKVCLLSSLNLLQLAIYPPLQDITVYSFDVKKYLLEKAIWCCCSLLRTKKWSRNFSLIAVIFESKPRAPLLLLRLLGRKRKFKHQSCATRGTAFVRVRQGEPQCFGNIFQTIFLREQRRGWEDEGRERVILFSEVNFLSRRCRMGKGLKTEKYIYSVHFIFDTRS